MRVDRNIFSVTHTHIGTHLMEKKSQAVCSVQVSIATERKRWIWARFRILFQFIPVHTTHNYLYVVIKMCCAHSLYSILLIFWFQTKPSSIVLSPKIVLHSIRTRHGAWGDTHTHTHTLRSSIGMVSGFSIQKISVCCDEFKSQIWKYPKMCSGGLVN